MSTPAWFAPGTPRPGATVQLFCLPHGGAGASTYRDWPDRLPPGVETVPVRLPGRESRYAEPPARRSTEITDRLVGPLLDRAPGRFALFGHSLGALLAYEVAQEAAARGRPPAHLFVSGCPAPHLPPRPGAVRVHTLPDDDLIAYLAGLDGTPGEVLRYPDLMRSLLPVLRADYEICETYEYRARPPLPVPVTVLAGTRDPYATDEELAAWRQRSTRDVTVRRYPGGHFYLLEHPEVVTGSIAERLPAT